MMFLCSHRNSSEFVGHFTVLDLDSCCLLCFVLDAFVLFMHKCIRSETAKGLTFYPACLCMCFLYMTEDTRPQGQRKTQSVPHSPKQWLEKWLHFSHVPVLIGWSDKGQMFAYEGSGLHHKEGTPKSGDSEFCFLDYHISFGKDSYWLF